MYIFRRFNTLRVLFRAMAFWNEGRLEVEQQEFTTICLQWNKKN